MRILIVEDEVKTAAYMSKGFTENGFVVDVAQDGADGQHMARTQDYDMVILDVMMPRSDGWTMLQALRRTRQTPVLFVTAKGSIEDKVKGLELGADDYLVKPFAFSELLARVRSVLRRGAARNPEVLKVADLEVDFPRHRVERNHERIDLTSKEFSLLLLLIRRAGEVLSRTYIAEQVWDMNFDGGTNVVDVAIRRLRAKIDDAFDNKLIHNIRGVGYVLEERT